MSRPKSARLRMSLFASSSLVGSSLLAGMGGLVVTMAPGAALAAATTCTPTPDGTPPAYAPASGTQTCTGTDDNGVAYSATGALTVVFNNETVVTGGVQLTDTGATGATITFDAKSGTNSITNNNSIGPAGAGLSIVSTKNGPIVADAGATSIYAINGDGVYITSVGGNVSFTSAGTITANTPNGHYGVEVVNSGSGSTTVSLATVADGGVRLVNGGGGGLSLTASGNITNKATNGAAAIEMFEPSPALSKGNPVAMSLTTSGSVTSATGSAVKASTTGNAPISLTFNGAGAAITGAATLANPVINTSTVTGAVTVNLGVSKAPTNSGTAPAAAVTVGTSSTGLALGASGGGNVSYNVGQSIKGNDATVTVTNTVTQLGGTAVLNGHVNFKDLTANSSIVLFGETLQTTASAPLGTYTSVWNLGGTKSADNSTTFNTSNFGSGNDTIENRGVINVVSTSSTTPTQVTMNFNGPTAIPPVVGPPAVAGAMPVQTGTANSDRIYNRGAQAPSSVQNLYTPGTINIVGPNANLTVTGLEVFTNEGAAYLNIRNNDNVSDFVGVGGSKTAASAQSFVMNPVTSGKNSDYYATSSGTPVNSNFSQFALLQGTLPAIQGANGIPGQQRLSGGVNLADGDTLDVFAISGQLYGNSNYNSTPVTGSRFLVDFDLKNRAADQLWFGDLVGNVSVIPRFTFAGADIAATYDPAGIRFATILNNPAQDNSFIVDYQSFFNQKDTTYLSLPNTLGDQGLYRAFVEYRQDQGARSITGGGTTFTSTTPTGGYFLVFQPDTEFFQLATVGSAVQEAVRDATGTYFTRQADLRDAVGDGPAGAWLKITGSRAKLQEDIPYPFFAKGPGYTRTIGNYYTQTTVDITAGGDYTVPVGPGKVVVGAAVGYTDSDLRFLGVSYGGVSGGQVSAPVPFIPTYGENRTAMEGYHIGGYASYIQDQLFVDAALSYTSLDLRSLWTTLNNAVFSGNTKTLNGKILGGYRFVTDDVFSVEPVVGLDFMQTEQDDLNFNANVGATSVTFPKFRSLRPGIGGRVKVASATDLYKINLGLGVMWWRELKKEGSQVKATSGGYNFRVADLRGNIEDTAEINASANMIFANGLSAFMNFNAHGNFDAYGSYGFTAGARYRW